MSEQEVREFEENIVKGANIAFQRLVNQKKKEDGELVFSRNGYIFRVKAADLEKALNDCKNQAPKAITETVTNNKQTLESVVTFRQGGTSVESSQTPNVERIATYLKNHKNATVSIKGYASPEGNADVNARIAKQRAESVKNMLINRYKIAANRITAEGQGVGNMFEEPDWNRVSICTINED